MHVDVGYSTGTSYSRSISEEYSPDIEPDYAEATHSEHAFNSVDEDLELSMEDLEDDLAALTLNLILEMVIRISMILN